VSILPESGVGWEWMGKETPGATKVLTGRLACLTEGHYCDDYGTSLTDPN